jgi:hypothetical protein
MGNRCLGVCMLKAPFPVTHTTPLPNPLTPKASPSPLLSPLFPSTPHLFPSASAPASFPIPAHRSQLTDTRHKSTSTFIPRALLALRDADRKKRRDSPGVCRSVELQRLCTVPAVGFEGVGCQGYPVKVGEVGEGVGGGRGGEGREEGGDCWHCEDGERGEVRCLRGCGFEKGL